AVSANGSGHTVVTLTFAGSETDPNSGPGTGPPVAGPSLADGRYRLITGAAGTGNGAYVSPDDTLDGPPGLHLYRDYGDVDGNGVVDSTDLGQFRLAYNTS